MEKFPTCRNHPEVILGSKIENHTGTCLACIEVKLAGQADLEVQNHDLKVQADQAERRAKEAEEKVSQVQRLLRAETEGIRAASQGLPDDQNPYPAGDQLCAMWLNGWQSVETKRMADKSMAVIDWATKALQNVHELAVGYNQQEIATKVGTVAEKLAQVAGI